LLYFHFIIIQHVQRDNSLQSRQISTCTTWQHSTVSPEYQSTSHIFHSTYSGNNMDMIWYYFMYMLTV